MGKREARAAQFVDWLILRGVPREEAADKVRWFLDASTPARRKTDKIPVAIAEQAKPIMQQYRQLYLARYHEEPLVTGQDFANAYKLLAKFGPQAVSSRLNAFFGWDDLWVAKQGYRFGLFFKQWDALTAVMARATPVTPKTCRHSPPCPDAKTCSRKFLDEHRRLSGETTSSPLTT